MTQTSKHTRTSQEEQDGPQSRRRPGLELVGALLWLLAVIGMVMLSLFARAHRRPLSYELMVSRAVQASITAPWIATSFRFLTLINNPQSDIFTVIAVIIVFVLLRWFRQVIFFALAVIVGDGVNAFIGDIVGRPRPTPNLVHVDSRLIFNSFPSGHSCYMMVFYGFLFFLSLTWPVRTWRYHWLVLIFQAWALINILLVGFARIWEGEHWLVDVLGGYLDGAIWMSLCMYLYLLATRELQKRKDQKKRTIESI